MGLLDWLKGNKKEETKTEIVEKPKIEPRVISEEDALDLGWYWSENKDEMQMAKIEEKDRRTHLYVVGASGAGKSKFLEFLIRQDILKPVFRTLAHQSSLILLSHRFMVNALIKSRQF